MRYLRSDCLVYAARGPKLRGRLGSKQDPWYSCLPLALSASAAADVSLFVCYFCFPWRRLGEGVVRVAGAAVAAGAVQGHQRGGDRRGGGRGRPSAAVATLQEHGQAAAAKVFRVCMCLERSV